MNILGFENTKDLSDKIQEITEGEEVSNQLGTNNVNEPVDDDISDFNKGVDVMTNIGNYHVLSEGMFSKKAKSGTYREPVEDDVDDEIESHPMISTKDTFKGLDTSDRPFKPDERAREQERERRKGFGERRSGIDERNADQ